MVAVEQYNFPANLDISPSIGQSSQSPRNSDYYAAQQDIETFGIAGRTWEASYALLSFLSSDQASSIEYSPLNPICAAARSPLCLIDVGAGTGNLSLSLLPRLQCDDVAVMTDLEDVLPLLETNLASWRNSKSATEAQVSNILVQRLEWGRKGDVETLLGFVEPSSPRAKLIIGSDLIYFDFLYPLLLRTLLELVDGAGPTQLIMSYKIRSLVKEMPFWQAFGKYFDFYPVLSRRRPPSSLSSSSATDIVTKHDQGADWTVIGVEEGIFVFICDRKVGTESPCRSSEGDAELMRAGDDQFEMLLMSSLEL